MNLSKMTVAPLLATAMAVTGAGVCQAEPAHAPAKVNFTVGLVDKTVVTTLDQGTFELARSANSVVIKDNSGGTVESLPLTYTLGGLSYPVRQEISPDKRTLRLTPDTNRADAVPVATATADSRAMSNSGSNVTLKPIASDQENALAQQSFMNQLGIATSVGSIVGTIIGAVLGGVAGLVTALASCVALLACLFIGLPIFVTFATAGGIAGTVIAGGGALVSAGWDYVQTLQAAPGTTHWRR